VALHLLGYYFQISTWSHDWGNYKHSFQFQTFDKIMIWCLNSSFVFKNTFFVCVLKHDFFLNCQFSKTKFFEILFKTFLNYFQRMGFSSNPCKSNICIELVSPVASGEAIFFDYEKLNLNFKTFPNQMMTTMNMNPIR
jgi:hypothetical protein